MKMLTLWQPWASLVALGFKKYETRSWSTSYRGSLVIHASKRALSWKDLELWEEITGVDPHLFKFPVGSAIALVDLVDCQQMVSIDSDVRHSSQISIASMLSQEKLAGIWEPERYAWKLENVRLIEPAIACCGFQGLRDAPDEVLRIASPELQRAIALSPLQLSLF